MRRGMRMRRSLSGRDAGGRYDSQHGADDLCAGSRKACCGGGSGHCARARGSCSREVAARRIRDLFPAEGGFGLRGFFGFQRRHVDHEAVFHVALEHALVGFVDLLDGGSSRCPAAMLCSAQKSSISCVSAMPPMAEPARERRCMMRLNTAATGAAARRRADQDQRAVALQQVEMKGSRSCAAATVLRMKSKLPACFAICVGVFRDDDFVGAEAFAVVDLVGRGGEEDDVRAERVGELDAHVAQAAEADDADLLARARRSNGAAASRW